jgi:hypothetical protein
MARCKFENMANVGVISPHDSKNKYSCVFDRMQIIFIVCAPQGVPKGVILNDSSGLSGESLTGRDSLLILKSIKSQ